MNSHLPEEHQVAHDFCFFLHDVMFDIFNECIEDGELKTKIVERDNKLEELENTADPITWLRSNGYSEEADTMLKKRIFHALLGDMLNYIYESLSNSEKGKSAVSYTLLRKPFKDNLFYLEWLASNPKELLELVETANIDTYEVGKMKKNNNPKMKGILRDAYNKNHYKEWFKLIEIDKNYFYKLRYDYNTPYSLELMWNSANHLVTTARTIRTEDFNGIFLESEDFKRRWAYYYTKLPLLMLYTLGLIIYLFNLLFEKLSSTTKTYNDLFIMTKFLSLDSPDMANVYIKTFLKQSNIPLLCNSCDRENELTTEAIFDIKYSSYWECRYCGNKINLAQYWIETNKRE